MCRALPLSAPVARGSYAELRKSVNDKACMLLSSLGLLLHAVDLCLSFRPDEAVSGHEVQAGRCLCS